MEQKPAKLTKFKRIFELDALRGLAALAVVLFHFSMSYKTRDIFKYGVTGVDLFFMISGFVILLTVERTANAKEFLLNRLSRLYPTYWICVTITTALLCIHNSFQSKVSLFKYLVNLTMFQQLVSVKDIDGPYWTMIVEMLFYVYVVVVMLCRKLHKIEVISLCILFLNFIFATPWIARHQPYLAYGIASRLPIVNHFPLFFAGMIFRQLKENGASPFRYIAIVLCFICQLMLFDRGGRAYFYIGFTPYLLSLGLYFSLFFLFINGKLTFIINRATLFLGKISFALYLIHQAISLQIIMPYLLRFTNWWIAAGISFAVVAILAALINKYIEVQAMHYLRKKYKTTHTSDVNIAPPAM